LKRVSEFVLAQEAEKVNVFENWETEYFNDLNDIFFGWSDLMQIGTP
jgi:hypothetical protein